MSSAAFPGHRPFVITREFAAPRAVMWRAWSELDQLKAWWGPAGFTIPVARQDFRVGGIFHYCMQSADGHRMWGRFVYREITPPVQIVWVNSFSDEAGNLAPVPFSDPWPTEMLNVVTFTEAAGRTKVTIESSALNASAAEQKTFDANHDSMNGGWTGTLDQLATHLGKTSRA